MPRRETCRQVHTDWELALLLPDMGKGMGCSMAKAATTAHQVQEELLLLLVDGMLAFHSRQKWLRAPCKA